MIELTIDENSKILEALERINVNQKGFLVVVRGEYFAGTLTDGDIRRALINGANLESSIGLIYNRNCVTLSIDGSISDAFLVISDPKIEFIPILNDRKLVNIITEKQLELALLYNLDIRLTYDFSSLDEGAIDYSIAVKPWGFFKTTVINNFYQSKVLHLIPGASISLQRHKLREEYWIVVYGIGEARIDDSKKLLNPGTIVFIPKNSIHRLTNKSMQDTLVIVEVQLGESFKEDDVERIFDDYGRDLCKR